MRRFATCPFDRSAKSSVWSKIGWSVRVLIAVLCWSQTDSSCSDEGEVAHTVEQAEKRSRVKIGRADTRDGRFNVVKDWTQVTGSASDLAYTMAACGRALSAGTLL